MDNESKLTSRVLPPWLWVWFIFYLIQLPAQVTFFWLPMLKDLFSQAPQTIDQLIPFVFLSRLSNLVELAPLFIVGLGVLSIFLPFSRSQKVEQKFRLKDLPFAEIREFLSKYAPGLMPKSSFSSSSPFIYPLGYRTTAIALFPGVISKWREDRKVAEAIILHETAHYRQGDALVLGNGGTGEFFINLLNAWVPLTLAFVSLPMVFVEGISVFNFVFDHTLPVEVSPISERILFQVGQIFTHFLPSLGFMIVIAFLWTASVLILPLMAIWCAEFNADRFAIDTQQANEGLIRALTSSSSDKKNGFYDWLTNGMTHPPISLRVWFAQQAPKRYGLVLLLLFFPLAYLIKLVLLQFLAIVNYAAYKPAEQIIAALIENTRTYFQTLAPFWVAMAGLLLLWPWLVVSWEGFFCRDRFKSEAIQNYPSFVVAGLGLLGFWAITRLF